jgi:hypothetical protein
MPPPARPPGLPRGVRVLVLIRFVRATPSGALPAANCRLTDARPRLRPRLDPAWKGPIWSCRWYEFSGFPQPIRLRPSPVRLLLHGASLVEAQGYNKRQYPALDR